MSQPGIVRKICIVCGVDVARQKRTKDQAGRYYCEPCLAERVAQPVATTAASGGESGGEQGTGELDVADAPPWEVPESELLIAPPPIVATPATQWVQKPQAVVAEPTKTNHARKMLSLFAGALGIAFCLLIVVGVCFGVRSLFRSVSIPKSKTTFAISNPTGLSATPYYDSELNCHIRLPVDSGVAFNHSAGIQHTFEAAGDDFILKVRASDRDEHADFQNAVLMDRNLVVLAKGNSVTIDDEGATTIGSNQAYMVSMAGGTRKDRTHDYVVWVDGPDGRMFVITGEASESDWPVAKSAIESTISTFAPGT